MSYSRSLGFRTKNIVIWVFHSYLNVPQKSLNADGAKWHEIQAFSAGTADTEKGLGDYTALYCSCESHIDQTYAHTDRQLVGG